MEDTARQQCCACHLFFYDPQPTVYTRHLTRISLILRPTSTEVTCRLTPTHDLTTF
jgi:hypothetical protein